LERDARPVRRRDVGSGFIAHIAKKAGVVPHHSYDAKKGRDT
jgi:hypothetical protein